MTAGRDFLLFILFLVFLGVAWFLTGGPDRAISHAGWFLNPSMGTSSGGISVPMVNIPRAPNASSSDSSAPDTGQAASRTTQSKAFSLWNYFFSYKPGMGDVLVPATSPYAQYVSLDTSNTRSSDPATEYVTIRISRDLPSSVTVSDWALQSVSKSIYAPLGNATPLPFLGQTSIENPVSVGPGSVIYVTTGSSPNGSSFRVNECVGYLGQFQTFTPNFDRQCPTPSDEIPLHPEVFATDEACRRYVETLPQCTFTAPGSFPTNLSGTCQNFIANKLSYNGCVDTHKNDPTFYKNEWRLFLKRGQELWNNDHGSVRLIDENGRLIAEESY